MKLYTRRGDDGATDLFVGGRTPKADPRIHALGEVDETNAVIGLALAVCEFGDICDILTEIQTRLFDLGADLATDGPTHAQRIKQLNIDELEHQIDAVCNRLPALNQFILPGGSELAARLHLARTVCRRAERACVALQMRQPESRLPVVYLNRLSDLLFALARRANQQAGVDDVPWKG